MLTINKRIMKKGKASANAGSDEGSMVCYADAYHPIRAICTSPKRDRYSGPPYTGQYYNMTSYQAIQGLYRSVTVKIRLLHTSTDCVRQGLPYRAVRTSPPADQYADCPLLGDTIEINQKSTVDDRFRPSEVDVDHRKSTSIGISQGREKEEKGEEEGEKPGSPARAICRKRAISSSVGDSFSPR
ncbi:hypothetical protein BHE74_00031344 [Ensete ventricosum]|nr:hypothetical protein GW17_00035740 [Ensete ventricosum]RWW61590.1 hypothetical protein BHE74_00031344 [Ensete ventricosum]RZR79678.1 hypothetical protein BHM03_00005469 [Ensete ventricosum]